MVIRGPALVSNFLKSWILNNRLSYSKLDATDHRSPYKLARACWRLWVWTSASSACFPTPNVVRHDTCRHNCAVERERTGRLLNLWSQVQWSYLVLLQQTNSICYLSQKRLFCRRLSVYCVIKERICRFYPYFGQLILRKIINLLPLDVIF